MIPVFLEALDAVATASRRRCAAARRRRIRTPSAGRSASTGASSSSALAGPSDEPFASTIDESGLATEWEWERSPELTLVVTAERRRRRHAVQPLQPPLRHVGDHRRPGGVRTVLRSARHPLHRERVHPLGRRPVRTRSTRSSASPTGRAAGCSGAGRSCPATACTPCGTWRASTTPPFAADPVRRRLGRSEPSEPHAVDVGAASK